MIAIPPLSIARKHEVDEDAELMVRCGQGELEAFEMLVDRYYERVVGIIEHLMGNRSHSRDLAQEVFLRVYRARETYQPRSKFSTWLFVIVNNVVRNARRSLARRKESSFGNPPYPGELAPVACDDQRQLEPADAAMRDELRQTVRRAISDLNHRQQTAILLYHFRGLSYAEVAEQMETTLCATKALLHRARTRLQGQLQAYENA